ncbi:MAG: DUF3298 domain-containing protein [Oscillospiraceae bacterium]|nr:DUF3298 domain-containing protein [Oscillospiraceae bacterium]
MKKQIAIILALSVAITLAGCAKTPTNTPTPTETVAATHASTATTAPTAPTGPAETMIAVDVGVTTQDTTAEDGTVLFQRTNQKMHLILNNAEVADKITKDFLNRLDIEQDATTIEATAKAAYNGNANWMPYFYGLTYNPQRIDQKVLSFYGDKVKFTGTAHPERSRKGANYDLATGDVLTLASIMTAEASTDDFCKLVLEALAERAEGDFLREGYSEDVKRRFTSDPTQDENWYFTTAGLCFYFDPYEIAPYTSGVITAEIPYEKLNGLVHTDYLPAARATATGEVTISAFTSDLAENFNHTAELVMDPEGKMYLVHTEGTVQDIRITFTDDTGSYTVFAANSLSDGEAIMVQAQDARNLELSYLSNGRTVKEQIIKRVSDPLAPPEG